MEVDTLMRDSDEEMKRNLPFVEKYRPESLEDIVSHQEVKIHLYKIDNWDGHEVHWYEETSAFVVSWTSRYRENLYYYLYCKEDVRQEL